MNKFEVLAKASLEDYNKLVTSGMFWELYPWATGYYREDVETARGMMMETC